MHNLKPLLFSCCGSYGRQDRILRPWVFASLLQFHDHQLSNPKSKTLVSSSTLSPPYDPRSSCPNGAEPCSEQTEQDFSRTWRGQLHVCLIGTQTQSKLMDTVYQMSNFYHHHVTNVYFQPDLKNALQNYFLCVFLDTFINYCIVLIYFPCPILI